MVQDVQAKRCKKLKKKDVKNCSELEYVILNCVAKCAKAEPVILDPLQSVTLRDASVSGTAKCGSRLDGSVE
jgi:hypothetical protein